MIRNFETFVGVYVTGPNSTEKAILKVKQLFFQISPTHKPMMKIQKKKTQISIFRHSPYRFDIGDSLFIFLLYLVVSFCLEEFHMHSQFILLSG